MKTIAFVGLSGVGKSTFLKAAMGKTSFLHLEASKLIKEELKLRLFQNQSSEDLRTGAVLDNQELLLRAFHRNVAGQEELVVLDGHTVVDTGSGLQRLPASVFDEMEVKSIFFLQDDPGSILSRRANDTSRIRPERTIQEIANHQQVAILTAADIALSLAIPMHLVTHDQTRAFFKIVQL
ncbi:AAA family ATPase [Ruegeria sp. HKCCA4008]|uniref:AAA family ATPase n=1 Tax=Ruegeria sp. HKCCA4008 TaxID=2682999 RepID=UPI001488335E|nr:AAA family ATPase [Ruegeria sp. HKCCA4008]